MALPPAYSATHVASDGTVFDNPGALARYEEKLRVEAQGQEYTGPAITATAPGTAPPPKPKAPVRHNNNPWYAQALDVLDPLGVSSDLARAASAGDSFADKATNVANAATRGVLRGGPRGKLLDAVGLDRVQDFLNPGGEALAAAADELTDRQTGNSGISDSGDPLFGLGRDNAVGSQVDNRVFDRLSEADFSGLAGNKDEGGGGAGGGDLGDPGERPVDPIMEEMIQSTRDNSSQAQAGLQDSANTLRGLGDRAAAGGRVAASGFRDQAAAAGGRQAPQIRENEANRTQVTDQIGRLQNHQVGGAQAVQNLQNFTPGGGEQQSRLDNFQAGGTQELGRLNTFQAGGAAEQSALNNFQADTSGIAKLDGFSADTSGVADLQNFRAGRGGVDRLNEFADAPEGESRAQAMLNLENQKNQGQSLGLARSARGGAGAVAQALKTAQGENAMQSSTTRGQMALVQADESDRFKTRQLSALSEAGRLGSAQDSLDLGAKQSASGDLLQGSAQNLGAATAASGDRLTASGQKLGASTAAANTATTRSGQQLNAAQSAASTATAQSAQQLTAASNAANTAVARSAQGLQAQTSAGQLDLNRSAQTLQAADRVMSAVERFRDTDVDLLKANMNAELEQLGLNDQQTRAMAGLAESARMEGDRAAVAAEAAGTDADMARANMARQADSDVWQMLTQQQRFQFEVYAAQKGWDFQSEAQKAQGFSAWALGGAVIGGLAGAYVGGPAGAAAGASLGGTAGRLIEQA